MTASDRIIEQFFNITGIRVMDELSAPWRSALPSQLSAQRRAPVQTTESALAGYVVAMAVVAPQLKLYSHVATDLQRWIEHSKEIYREAEAEAAKVTPMLFREYLMADGQMQAELLPQLKLIKANDHATAKSQWYDWRLQWVDQLYAIADQGFGELQQPGSDAKLDGLIVREIWVQSRPKSERLWDIWNECDRDGTGSLNRDAVARGMAQIDEELRRTQVLGRARAGSGLSVWAPRPNMAKPSRGLFLTVMSSTASSANFRSIFDVALDNYIKQTGIDLTRHSSAHKLQNCHSTEDILQLLLERETAFKEYRDKYRRLIDSLRPVVQVVHIFSGTLSKAANLVPFPPTKAIFAGIDILLSAVISITTSYDALIQLFESVANFLRRLHIYTQIPLSPTTFDVLVRIMGEILSVLALATRQINEGRFKIHQDITWRERC
ncbi:Spc7 kinetochore protein-domain-containing protein [Russula dissimulans]|nr:Spc7 kinetochore protein-domain-containing protein [Russula dissimulans]